jgi:iron complex outermembrane receptor protein
LTWNTTVFFEQLQNFQVSYTDPNTLVSELQSVPSVSTRGVETELAMRPLTGMTLQVAGGYDIAKVNNWSNAPCYPNETVGQGCVNHNNGLGAVQNMSGGRLANAPKYRANFTGEQDLPINDDYSLILNATYRWQSDVYFATNEDPGSLQKGFGIANLGAGLQAEHWKAMFTVNNIANQYYATYQARSCVQCTINPFGATAGKPISDAIISAPARDAARYVMFRISADY